MNRKKTKNDKKYFTLDGVFITEKAIVPHGRRWYAKFNEHFLK